MGAGKDVFTHFAVRVERRKDEGGEGAHRKKDDEEIEEVPMERVKRLSTVLRLNGVADEIIRKVVSIFKLNLAWWGDPYRVDALLTAHVSKKRELVTSLTDQYWSGVKVPESLQRLYPSRQGEQIPSYGGGRGWGDLPIRLRGAGEF